MSYKPKVLEVAAGGTGAATFTSNGLVYGNGTGALQSLAVGSTVTVLTGTGGVPAWSGTPTISSITINGGTALNFYVQILTSAFVSFGGGSTGITYSQNACEYTQIGNLVTFGIAITLTSKGSSTGVLAISLPVASGGTTCAISIGRWKGLTLDAGFTQVGAITSGSSLLIYENGSNQTPTQLTDTYVSGTAQFWITGSYFTS